ncbi:MAG: CRISPR-associated RAMP protein Csx7 [Candidatus Bathyarchaeia archaeon]|nr:CRISPR-associated RAMP protein [Candidatus Bathyarchaeota archaeon]
MQRYVFKFTIIGKIINQEPLSIGAGKKALVGGIDNPIVRLEGKPYIPGSSLKGVLRSEAERYVKTLGNPKFTACNIFTNEELDTKKKKESKGESYEPCIICKIFGGPTISSAVTIYNSIAENVITETRTCVSISRITGAQIPRRLYDIEYVIPNSEFSTRIDIDANRINLEDNSKDETKILLYLLSRLIRGEIILGGRKSIGMGRIALKVDKIEKKFIENGELKIEEVKGILG